MIAERIWARLPMLFAPIRYWRRFPKIRQSQRKITFTAIIYGQGELQRTQASVRRASSQTPCQHVDHLHQFNPGTVLTDYVFFVEAGDVITKNAITKLCRNIATTQADIVYSDETTAAGIPFYKPDYSPDLLRSLPYFGHLLCVKTALLHGISLPIAPQPLNYLYALTLKLLRREQNVSHIADVLYIHHKQKDILMPEDYFHAFHHESGKQALLTHCQALGWHASVQDGAYPATYRVEQAIKDMPLISIIIPTRDKADLLKQCIQSILAKSTYEHFEIIGIDNGSVTPEAHTVMIELAARDSRVTFYHHDAPFNYSELMNYAVTKAKGDHFLLLNNDTEVISPDWIESLLVHSQRPEVGIVGAKLLYADGRIQHAGMSSVRIQHTFRGLPNSDPGYFFFPHVIRNYNILTFACVMVSRRVYSALGPLDEKLAVSCNDVEYCVRARAEGYLNVYTPHACLYHYESQTRGAPYTLKKLYAEQKERNYTFALHPDFYSYDEYDNPHLLRAPKRLKSSGKHRSTGV